MINEASTLLSTIVNLKGIRLEGNKYRVTRMDDDRQAWSDHRLFAERVFHRQAALHLQRRTQTQVFHQEHDHWRVAGRNDSHHGSSRRLFHRCLCQGATTWPASSRDRPASISKLINLTGVRQICIGTDKMDCDTAGHKLERYDEVSSEMKSMLRGWCE